MDGGQGMARIGDELVEYLRVEGVASDCGGMDAKKVGSLKGMGNERDVSFPKCGTDQGKGPRPPRTARPLEGEAQGCGQKNDPS